jgi:signal transduction histidine kinase
MSATMTVTTSTTSITSTTSESDAPRAEQLRELALALADAEARERKRLARVLHDHFQQLLSAAKLKAGILRRLTPDESTKDHARQIERLLEEALSASRSLAIELSPPVLHEAGLGAAIESLARSLEKQHAPLKITARCDGRAEPQAEQVRVLLFEAVREFLNNVITHAGATTASVDTGLLDDGQIQIIVSDDGRGFDPDAALSALTRAGGDDDVKPLGLLEIGERLRWLGGALDVQSRLGAGTRVTLRIPAVLRPVGEDATHSPARPQAVRCRCHGDE